MHELPRMATDPLIGVLDQRSKELIKGARPMLAQLPRWVELTPYLEYGENEVPICMYCKTVCNIAYFKLLQFNTKGLELCGNCLEKHKLKKRPWTLYVREGVIQYLSVLNAHVSKPASTEAPVALQIKPNNGVKTPTSAPLPPSTNSALEHRGTVAELTCQAAPFPQQPLPPVVFPSCAHPLVIKSIALKRKEGDLL